MMAGNYQHYSALKDSGVEWLGQMPVHWSLINGKWLFPERNTKALKSDKQLTASQKHGVIYQEDFMVIEGQKVVQVFKGSDILKHVESHDFVISMRSFQGGIEYCAFRGCVSSAYVPIIPTPKVHIHYFRYLLKCGPYIQGLQSTTNLVRDGQALRYGNFTQVLLPDIPLIEQEKIAQFLDYEIPKIDTLIDKQQQLIKLLKEKRQAVISHAVTKGLNPDAPMKDTGIEWLGEVPKHWGVCKLGYCAKIGNGATPARENLAYWDDGSIGWLNSSKVNDVYISSANQFITPLALVKTGVQEVDIDDLVIAITGEGQTRGRVAICKVPATINQHLAAISIRDKRLHYEYLFFWLTSRYERIRYESTGAGSTKGAITCTDIVSYPVPLPAIDEQKKIVTFIKESEGKLTNLIELSVNQTALLQERRTALISAAVTGKIDVRNWQPAPSEPNREG